jgi:hypothetical protein
MIVSSVSYKKNAITEWLIDNSHMYSNNDKKMFFSEFLYKVLLSKAPAWSYEKEARIVRYKAGTLEIPRNILTTVIFGLQTSKQDEQLVKNVVNKYYNHVKIGRAVRNDDDDFGIGTIEI